MIRWLALCVAALCLAALPLYAQGALTNAHTGVSGIYTDQLLISDHPHHVLMGHVIVVNRDGQQVRALVIQQRRDGVHRLRFREAWTEGIALPFDATHLYGRGCTHGHCRDNQIGMIFLSTGLFDRAQSVGLTARLIGPSGAILITVPATLFTDAAIRAARM